MDYISVKEASKKFKLSERRIQKLCEENRIEGAKMISNIWLIPYNAKKPSDKRIAEIPSDGIHFNLKDLCKALSISQATAKNWLKLGKLIPSTTIADAPMFSHDYVRKLKAELKGGNNPALKSRRNKKFVSGNGIYKSYIAPHSVNNLNVQALINSVGEPEAISDEMIQLYVAECALQMICQKKSLNHMTSSCYLNDYLQGKLILHEYKPLIDDFIVSKSFALTYIENHLFSFQTRYTYEVNEDILGLIYISLKNIGNRKAQGAYYTPTNIVKKLIDHLSFTDYSKTILDPCCGTGNFLLQLPQEYRPDSIYGNDIDKTSILITRLNISLKFDITDYCFLQEHFTVSDYLSSSFQKYDFIIGNPPWGYDFSDEEKELLRKTFSSAVGKNIESYDIFIEKSYENLNSGGTIAFVLPEAILNVKTHAPIREVILKHSFINTIEFLGNTFDKVQCPCIIFQCKLEPAPFSTIGLKIVKSNSSFTIDTERKVTAEYFNFSMTDEEYVLFQKLLKLKNLTSLKNNADFALGIVTGSNKDYITSTKNETNEIILKGADVYKYKAQMPENYITFLPESFQQVAPAHFYRATEKLFYRFISNQLVFAYDNQQTLSLNSCNIVIPHIPGLHLKYVLAVLNSRITQYIFHHCFNSVKVLRSHIEKLPIPVVDLETQQQCIELVDKLILEQLPELLDIYYDELDLLIAKIFQLSDEEYAKIKESLAGQNNFLY